MTNYIMDHVLTGDNCICYTIDNFGLLENEYYKSVGSNTRYSSSIARKRYLHNTNEYNNIHHIEGTFPNCVEKIDTKFDCIILDANPNNVITELAHAILLLKESGQVFVCYDITVKNMAYIKIKYNRMLIETSQNVEGDMYFYNTSLKLT